MNITLKDYTRLLGMLAFALVVLGTVLLAVRCETSPTPNMREVQP